MPRPVGPGPIPIASSSIPGFSASSNSSAARSASEATHGVTKVEVKEISRSGNSVTLDITFPSPSFDSVSGKTHLYAIPDQWSDDPFQPVSISLRASKGSTATVVSREEESIHCPANFEIVHRLDKLLRVDDGKGGRLLPMKPGPQNPSLVFGAVQLHYAGIARSVALSSLQISAIDPQIRDNAVHFIRHMVVRVSLADPPSPGVSLTDIQEAYRAAPSVFKNRIAERSRNQIQAIGDAVQTSGLRADDGMVYRMYINTTGIYHLTYDDLKNFGIDPGSIDPNTLRIINKGQQIPVYIFDHQDGHIDPNDYIEFYGEEKLADTSIYGDQYYDPYTHNNVYFLVWGTSYSPIPAGGLMRMVEESGEIREARPGYYVDLKDSSFQSRIHFEEDLVNDPLDITDINMLSTLRDHDYIGIVQTGKTLQVETVVPYPDVRSNRSVRMRVALQGISHFDPGSVDAHGIELGNVPNEQQVDVRVNGTSFLQGIWDSQVLKFLSTDTASQLTNGVIPTSKLLGVVRQDSNGIIAPLTVQFINTLKSDEQYCRFAVNWFDIWYDRLYTAYQDQLRFRIPLHAPSALYQFTLSNFHRTDISIYRKGVSKISNVFIADPNQTTDQVKVIFQAHVSSDQDEFIAVLDSSKLKPRKYLRDDYLDLRNAANKGNYIIITSREHLKKTRPTVPNALEDLIQNRSTKHGLSTMLIDVANIYDEFSFGIRTPQAIKDFLKYAYFHWSVPPQYVLLTGVTHDGNDEHQQFAPDDQVPAPYIQTFDAGAAPADTWYTLIDGDDLLPDIVLGRLGSQTIEGDRAYYNKLIEYEQDLNVPGAWKNNSLFLSAAKEFDPQVDYILKRDVPSRVNAFRQQIIQGTPYFGTDQDLINKIDTGLYLLNYLGHGGAAIWADQIDSVGRQILVRDDVPRFQNTNRYNFVTSFTCFTALYTTPAPGILNTMILAPSLGAIGGIGTTSFGFQNNDFDLANAVLPHMYDTLAGTFGDRVFAGKDDFILSALAKSGGSGDLIPPTLMYAYHYLGDPYLSPNLPKDYVSLKISNRNLRPGDVVTIYGQTTITNGFARVELVRDSNSPLVPQHATDGIAVVNGIFVFTDRIPPISSAVGSYRVTVYTKTDSRFAAASTDVSFNTARASELSFNPDPIVPNQPTDLTASVIDPSGLASIEARITVRTFSSGGQQQIQSVTLPMTPRGDKYHVTIAGSYLPAGGILTANVVITLSGKITASDSITVVVGAASDVAAFSDVHHPSLNGSFRATSAGLVWRENIYNWGSNTLSGGLAMLLDYKTKPPVVLTSAGLPSIPAHGFASIDMLVNISTLDTSNLRFAVAPPDGPSPFNLRDSTLANDTTNVQAVPRGAIAYLANIGTTASGSVSATINLDNEVSVFLPPNAESNLASDVIRINRFSGAPILMQPDIHFLSMYSADKKIKYTGLRVVSDSLGAMGLASPMNPPATISVHLNLADSAVAAHKNDNIYLYRQDDRSKLWSILKTTRTQPDLLTAEITSLGNIAIAYHTDIKPPVVDLTVEGQVFQSGGDVPDHPHLTAVIQDANGIDITPGKTIVKIDGRVLAASEYALLDSVRTPTTVNLHLTPSLNDGNHSLSIQATDNNGLTNPEKALDLHVSHDFAVNPLGSYPNPFSNLMFLAYEIKGIAYASTVELDLFTVSGRQIRSLVFPSDDPTKTFGFLKGGTGVPTSLGYHEVWWDGRDDQGTDVANGVYFYRLKVTAPSATRESTGKFARIR